MSTDRRARLDRRTFIAGVAATGALAACGGDGSSSDDEATGAASDDSSSAGQSGGDQPGGGDFVIVQRVPDGILVPGMVRYPIQLARNAEFISDGPTELVAELADIDAQPLGVTVTAKRRDVVPDSYYDFRTEIADPGVYRLLIEGGPDGGVVFQVFGQEQVGITTPGELLPGFDTPTFDDARGVEAICTRDPECEFHSITLTEALTTGQSVAYLVGTPAFCSTGTCIPALEAMIEVMPDFASSAVGVHAEVFEDAAGTIVSPAMAATGLIFEPSMFITKPDGTLSERLDGIWNAEEFAEAMDRATA